MAAYHDTYAATWTRLFKGVGWDPDAPRTVVEIGSYEGSSAVWILEHLLRSPQSRLYCIDVWPEPERRARFDAAVRPYGDRVVPVQARSAEALPRLLLDGVTADLVYVDGSHRAADVLTDLVMSWPLLKLRGLMIVDDYLWQDPRYDEGSVLGRPKLAVDAFTNVFADKIQWAGNVPNLQAIFAKVAV